MFKERVFNNNMDFVEVVFANPQSNYRYSCDIESKLQNIVEQLNFIERRLPKVTRAHHLTQN